MKLKQHDDISKAYQALNEEDPVQTPAELDALILSRAHEAVAEETAVEGDGTETTVTDLSKARANKYKPPTRWMLPLASAAVLVICFSVIIKLPEESLHYSDVPKQTELEFYDMLPELEVDMAEEDFAVEEEIPAFGKQESADILAMTAPADDEIQQQASDESKQLAAKKLPAAPAPRQQPSDVAPAAGVELQTKRKARGEQVLPSAESALAPEPESQLAEVQAEIAAVEEREAAASELHMQSLVAANEARKAESARLRAEQARVQAQREKQAESAAAERKALQRRQEAESAAADESLIYRQTADSWVDKIKALLDAEQWQQAKNEFEAFRERFPEHRYIKEFEVEQTRREQK